MYPCSQEGRVGDEPQYSICQTPSNAKNFCLQELLLQAIKVVRQYSTHSNHHFRRSKILLLLISRFLLPPGKALVQSIRPLALTPIMLILVMALTNAASHAPLLSAKLLKGTVVSGWSAMFLSDGSVKGAWPFLVSE